MGSQPVLSSAVDTLAVEAPAVEAPAVEAPAVEAPAADTPGAEAGLPSPRERCAEAALLAPGLVHEMRQPLMAIRAGMHLLGRRMGENLTARAEWQLIGAQVARLEEIFSSYLELFSPAGPRVVPFEVETVLRRAVDLLAFRLRRLGAAFALRVQPGMPRGHAAPNALLHAAVNLLANALDALDAREGLVGRLEIAAVVEGDRVLVRVSNNAGGIAPEHRDKLFRLGFTTKPPGRGTGLGLHIARRMMQTCGGDVRLAAPDEPGRRPWAHTVFVIELPALCPN